MEKYSTPLQKESIGLKWVVSNALYVCLVLLTVLCGRFLLPTLYKNGGSFAWDFCSLCFAPGRARVGSLWELRLQRTELHLLWLGNHQLNPPFLCVFVDWRSHSLVHRQALNKSRADRSWSRRECEAEVERAEGAWDKVILTGDRSRGKPDKTYANEASTLRCF